MTCRFGKEPGILRRMDGRAGGQRRGALQDLDSTTVWIQQTHLAIASDTDKSTALRQDKTASLCRRNTNAWIGDGKLKIRGDRAGEHGAIR